ncbi:hypothetical protein AXG93_285s1210 [Marchantia polymorpha subsp. ruderalis]|uniref:Uncharacterized protein n=1 Tax=Marchantia polymorpha subsp. ruderalis TaxID=1480154 RepID=A0A176VRD7_MARPO|nr:hypothetical protein AXG93_285s1210 [Marchantia polymorpha subsp. ruderalis]
MRNRIEDTSREGSKGRREARDVGAAGRAGGGEGPRVLSYPVRSVATCKAPRGAGTANLRVVCALNWQRALVVLLARTKDRIIDIADALCTLDCGSSKAHLRPNASPSSSGEIHSPFDESSFETREKLADEECNASTDDETSLTVTLMEELATLIQVVKDGEVGLEEMHGDGNDGFRGGDSKRILARSRMARSVPDLCAYAGPDSKGPTVAAALKFESPGLTRPQLE